MTHPSRRIVSAGIAAVAVSGRAVAQQAPAVVTLFGDSIVAGYGLPPELGLAACLTQELQSLGVTATVLNSGVPGETSAGGRGRVKSAIRKDTVVCIVEFGGNDRRLGYPASMTRDCLDAIVKSLKARKMSVLLLGLKIPEQPGDERAVEFNAVFAEVAKANDIPLCPDFMGGVTRELRQADGAHPNAEGAALIAQKVAPFVVEALKARS
jgi:acyl-CoA thioesterase-1